MGVGEGVCEGVDVALKMPPSPPQLVRNYKVNKRVRIKILVRLIQSPHQCFFMCSFNKHEKP